MYLIDRQLDPKLIRLHKRGGAMIKLGFRNSHFRPEFRVRHKNEIQKLIYGRTDPVIIRLMKLNPRTIGVSRTIGVVRVGR